LLMISHKTAGNVIHPSLAEMRIPDYSGTIFPTKFTLYFQG